MAESLVRLHFEVEGDPVGKQRARQGRGRRFYTPERTTLYQQKVAARFLQVARGRLSPAAIFVEVRCFFKRSNHPDPDNVLKAVLDALTGLAYDDDRNIASSVSCEYDQARPRIQVSLQ